MYYDIHTHAFHPKISQKVLNQLNSHYGVKAVGSGLIEDLLERADNAGLDKVLIHTAATDPAQVIPANNWSIELKNKDPRIITFGTMHPDFHDPEKELARLERHGIKGLKFHPDFQSFFMDDPKFYELMEMVSGRFITMFHIGDKLPPEKNPSCPIKLKKLLGTFKDLTAIAAHMGGLYHWNYVVDHLAGENVYFDTSSSLPFIESGVLGKIFNMHPHEKILFGSDYPLYDPLDSMKELQARLKLTDTQLELHLSAATNLQI